MRVLVAESDRALGAFLRQGLDAEDYVVDVTTNDDEATLLVAQCPYDLLVLDVSPDRPGATEIIGRMRESKPHLAILVLTAEAGVEGRVRILDQGADDCLMKPFAFAELSARVRALLRRGSYVSESILRVEDLELNRIEHTVKRGGKPIDLTPKEFALLEYLLRHAGKDVTRTMIIENVWNLSFDTMTNVVDVYINYLRKKIDLGADTKLIQTVRGVGYQVRAPGAQPQFAH
jgi:two-component system, OmpR family, copper resistance phosphate regulon response regulator CusR